MTTGQEHGSAIDTSVPHSARIWNYWLGGKDNYPIDRQLAAQFEQVLPEITHMAQASRTFLGRMIHYLVSDAGISQFLDIGTGLPTADNTHQIVQAVNPRAKVVYVDNDPLVLAHANALLTSTPQGVTDYIHADLYQPESIIAMAREVLDFDRPIALNLSGILGHVPTADQARNIVGRLMAPMPSGSYLAINDGTTEPYSERLEAAMAIYNSSGTLVYNSRPRAELISIFGDLEPVEPGYVSAFEWRLPADADPIQQREWWQFGGIGRKS